ncbi:MAG TPA: hypothetical protein VFK89_12105 [Actinomycetota bacterium]|nr:hypothetical protein [Actinomycetota bacterium]
MKTFAAFAVVVLLLGACSSNDITAQGDRTRGGHGRKGGPEQGSKHGGGTDTGTSPGDTKPGHGSTGGPGETPSPGEVAPPGSQQPPQGFDDPPPYTGVDPSLARKSSTIEDPNNDAKTKGLPPAYAEAVGASIEGLGKNVRLTFTMNGSVPQQTGKGEYMVLAFGITGKDQESGYAVGANASDGHWTPYVGSKSRDSSQGYPGTFTIDGNHVIFVVPWSVVHGPRKFEWYASDAWYQQIGNQTEYSFDAIPDGHPGKFPG